MALIIILNMCILAIRLEWQGRDIAYQLGMTNDKADAETVELFCEIAEKLFNLLYCIELALRIYVYRREFFHQVFNVVDASIIVITVGESLINSIIRDGPGTNFAPFRLLRAFRIFRFARLVRYTEHWTDMRVLLRTLYGSVPGMAWGSVLLLGVMMVATALVVQASIGYLREESISLERRAWL